MTMWAPFAMNEDDVSGIKSFYDPYEGLPHKSDTFYEDPFANQLPYSGWCKVPRFNGYARRNQQSRERRAKLQLQQLKKHRLPDAQSVAYQSYRTTEANESTDETDDDDVSSDVSEQAIHRLLRLMDQDDPLTTTGGKTSPALPTISENATARQPSSAAAVASQPEEEILTGDAKLAKLAQAKAVLRVKNWLDETGLVDDYFMDPKSLPQNKRAQKNFVRASSDSITTTLSQEGFEIGPHGHTLEAEQVSLRVLEFQATTMRELDRASHELLEQEKRTLRSTDENLRLELEQQPAVVRDAHHARLNMDRVFTEVDFFHAIEECCHRLWAELSVRNDDSTLSSEYWSKIHDVVEDHLSMQSFLVDLILEWTERECGELPKNVEDSIRPKIIAVQELGTELKLQLLTHVGVAFGEGNITDLRQIVGAIRLYAQEVEDLAEAGYDKKQLKRAKSIMVMGIEELTLESICNDCEIRGHQLFQHFLDVAADDARSGNAEDANMEAALKACRTMTEAMQIIKRDVVPIFPKTWPILSIWSSCLGSICSQYIFQQIGGPEGNNLPFLTPDQMLRLMSWIEEFKHLSDYPSSQDAELCKLGKRFFVSIEDIVNNDLMRSSVMILTKVLSIMWEIHRLVEDQFILATQTKTNEWLDSVFEADHAKNQMGDGRLITSLPEDVWVLARVQLNAIQEHFTSESMVFFHACCIIFRCMHVKVRKVWRDYLEDVETCCAAANDGIRMIELAEVELEEIRDESDFTEEQFAEIDVVAEQLTSQFVKDAVFSAQSIHQFIFDPIDQALRGRLFEQEWEELTYNDLAVTIIRTMEDYLTDLERWLEESMLRKTLDALVKATVNFYIRHLLLKSIRRNNHSFYSVQRAMQRISGDIGLMEDFFESWISKFPALERVLEQEFEVIYAVVELLEIGAGQSLERDPTDFFPFMQKKLGKVEATKFVCCQLWHLLSAEGGREMQYMFEANRHSLAALEGNVTKDTDPSLNLTNVVVGVMKELKQNLKVKTVVRNVRSSIVTKAKAVKKRATTVIDRVADV